MAITPSDATPTLTRGDIIEIALSSGTIDAIAAQVVAKQPSPRRDYLGIFLPFIGVLLGLIVTAVISFIETPKIEYEKQRSKLELAAYNDFAKAQAAYFRANRSNATPQEHDSANLAIKDAAMRILLFSPAETVEKFEAFVRDIPRPPCIQTSPNDLAVYRDMRQNVLGAKAGNLSDASIAMVVYGCEFRS
jgi:hypothetical protein